jgi:glycosyltransferase involved in cell wall biosynthesis
VRPEAFGRVVLEAMACGVPILAAAEGGPREIVTEGGWLVPPRDPQALAAALVAALRLPMESLRAVGRQGRVRAEDRYSARRFAREVAEVLQGARHRT